MLCIVNALRTFNMSLESGKQENMTVHLSTDI